MVGAATMNKYVFPHNAGGFEGLSRSRRLGTACAGVNLLKLAEGLAKLTDLLLALANCARMTNSAGSIYCCEAAFEATIPRYRPLSPRGV